MSNLVFDKKYFAEKKQQQRKLSEQIYKYHAWQKMPGETDKEFRRRFTKRTVIIVDNTKTILGPCDEVISKEPIDT